MTLSTNELGSSIDKLYKFREERLRLERHVKELKSQEQEMRNLILECLELSGLNKASGQVATVGRKISVIPLVTDWDQVFQYIKQNDRFDLVQKRISILAWRETYDNQETIPGTEAVEDVDITLTKASKV